MGRTFHCHLLRFPSHYFFSLPRSFQTVLWPSGHPVCHRPSGEWRLTSGQAWLLSFSWVCREPLVLSGAVTKAQKETSGNYMQGVFHLGAWTSLIEQFKTYSHLTSPKHTVRASRTEGLSNRSGPRWEMLIWEKKKLGKILLSITGLTLAPKPLLSLCPSCTALTVLWWLLDAI